MLSTGRVPSRADPGPQPIAAEKENILPFGAPELPRGYVFTEWMRRAARVNLCIAVRSFDSYIPTYTPVACN